MVMQACGDLKMPLYLFLPGLASSPGWVWSAALWPQIPVTFKIDHAMFYMDKNPQVHVY